MWDHGRVSFRARRAFAVLKAWRAQCADRLGRFKTSEVGDLQDVSVASGTGGWYLLTYGPVAGDPDTSFFDAQGLAVVESGNSATSSEARSWVPPVPGR